MSVHKKWVLAKRPDGIPAVDCFELQESPLGTPGEKEVQVETLYISIDPGMRSRLSGDSYSAALGIGEVIESAGLGRVTQSNNDRFAVGDIVMGAFGWQSHLVGKPSGLIKLDPNMFQGPLTLTAAIGVLGIPGLTAYFGLLDLGAPKEGETVLVSSAAGT
ncbi:MAG: NADP-dependent oxidoreductase, partial [Alphaproteobacteria bacterium]